MEYKEIEDMPKKKAKEKSEPNVGLISAVALLMVGFIVLFIAFNTARVDVNFLFFKVHRVQLWWFTLLVIIFTVITDRLIRFVFRLFRKKKDS